MRIAAAKGFETPVFDAQRCFRVLLRAMSGPGLPVAWNASGLDMQPAEAAAAALTLLDYETPVSLAGPFASDSWRDFMTFHTNAPIVAPSEAAYVLTDWQSLPAFMHELRTGTPEYPDRSATVLIQVAGFTSGLLVMFSGPGIQGERGFQAEGLDGGFWDAAIRNSGLFPLGLDFIFCGPGAIAALPRSTRIKMSG
jgi:alpha-D-ribose 1-methylphosphonate 5-triphosphate synthase subunit PhnH